MSSSICLRFSRHHFRDLAEKVFQQTVGNTMGTYCVLLYPTSIQSLSEREEGVSITVQFHVQVHRWCIVYKQPRKLSWLDISCWTQKHDREQHFLLLLFISRDSKLETYNCDKRNDFNFHITNFCSSVAIFHLHCLWHFHLTAYTMYD